MSSTFVAVDVGATFIKGAVLDLDTQRVLHLERVPFPPFLQETDPWRREVDPAEVLRRVRDQLDRLVRLAPGSLGLMVSSQMHGLVLSDAHGEPLSPFVSWQDLRSLQPHPSGRGTYLDEMVSRLTPQERHELGNETRPGFPVSTLFWMVEQGQLPRRCVPSSLPDFLVSRLCGTAVAATETTQAAAHGAYDHSAGAWHRRALEKWGLEALEWPRIVSYREAVGSFPRPSDGGPMPCYAPVGDQQAALLGASVASDELSLNIATGSQVSLVGRGEWQPGNYQVRPFFDGSHLKTVTHIPAGRALNALVTLFTEIPRMQGTAVHDPWDYIAQSVSRVASTDIQAKTSFFPSTAGDQGWLSGLRERNLTIGHVFRAAFEDMARNYWAAAQRLAPSGGWSSVAFSGGLARKLEVLRSIILERFQCPARVSQEPEETLAGLLRLAQAVAGRTRSVWEQSDPAAARTMKHVAR